jgi:hypothetical protein
MSKIGHQTPAKPGSISTTATSQTTRLCYQTLIGVDRDHREVTDFRDDNREIDEQIEIDRSTLAITSSVSEQPGRE